MTNENEKYENLIEKLLGEIEIYQNVPEKEGNGVWNSSRNTSRKTGNSSYVGRDCLDDLRLSIKYLLFDLDATRRENLYFKKLLEDKES